MKSKLKILTVLGARPQFIKGATISRAIARMFGDQVEEAILHTGQHYDLNMSDIFFREMEIPEPRFRLALEGTTHGQMTGFMMSKIESVISEYDPDAVLVFGDTNSTLAGALAASKIHYPVIHVEAGLRSFDMFMPEEINRVLTDHVSSLLFVPTQAGIANLQREGISDRSSKVQERARRVHLVGDVMHDAALYYSQRQPQSKAVDEYIKKNDDQFCLATLHRSENTDDPEKLRGILAGLTSIARSRRVIFPVHPRTRKVIQTQGISLDGIDAVEPLGYIDMVALLKACRFVVTDSGGLQKEACFFKKNCVTTRTTTEWIELVQNGVNKLVGHDAAAIACEAADAAVRPFVFDPRSAYGDGRAAEQIVADILMFFEKNQ